MSDIHIQYGGGAYHTFTDIVCFAAFLLVSSLLGK